MIRALRFFFHLIWRGLVGPPPQRTPDTLPIPHAAEMALYPVKDAASLKHALQDNGAKVVVLILVAAPWILAACLVLCRNGWGGF